MQNSQQVLINTETLGHLIDAFKLLGPFIGFIGLLLGWAWNKMEKTQDKLEKVMTDHIKENDRLHDQLFTSLRETDAKLNTLIGEHHSRGFK